MTDLIIEACATLSRNVKDYPFPYRMDDKRASVIASAVYEAVNGEGNYELLPLSKLPESEARALVAKGVISKALASSEYGAAIRAKDESVCVMINERDHVVIRAFASDVDKAFEAADKVDDKICARLPYAFSDKLGYLTSSPSDVGTGLRISVTLFLPGLHLTETVSGVASVLSRVNLSLTPKAKNDTSDGYRYVLSSVRTLGLSEKEIVDSVKSAVDTIATYEEKARAQLLFENEVALKDKIWRSYGIASHCYRISTAEMLQVDAFIKLGAYYSILPVSDVSVLNKAEKTLLSHVIRKANGDGFSSSEEKEIYRAARLKDVVKNL